MFTGIITDVGRVRRLSRGAGPAGGIEATIATAYDSTLIPIGASIACSGPCLTVIAVEPGAFSVQASAETLACSTLGDWEAGTPINLERALRVGDELGGHIVSGHVDGVVPYIAPKGSVALDGISLTVNEVADGNFGVNIIPHTLAHTSLGEARPGQRLNLEIDPLARYVARLMSARSDNPEQTPP